MKLVKSSNAERPYLRSDPCGLGISAGLGKRAELRACHSASPRHRLAIAPPEVLAFEKEGFPTFGGQGIGAEVAHVERRRVISLSELPPGQDRAPGLGLVEGADHHAKVGYTCRDVIAGFQTIPGFKHYGEFEQSG